MVRLVRFDATGFAKVYTVAALIVAMVMMLPVLIIGGLAMLSQNDPAITAAALVASVAGLLVSVSLLVFVVSWLQAIVFNWALARTGGIDIQLAAVTGSQ
jgi:hypothetical protein